MAAVPSPKVPARARHGSTVPLNRSVRVRASPTRDEHDRVPVADAGRYPVASGKACHCHRAADRGEPATAETGNYFKMLTARAITRPSITREPTACTVMASLAQRASGITSVGLNAVASVKPRYR
jgi:hypothetical protein